MVGAIGPILGVDVALVVGQEQVGIFVEELVNQGFEQATIALGKEAGVDQVDGFLQPGVAVVIVPGVVAVGLECVDLVGGEAEEEEVFVAHQFPNFHVGPIESADGEGTVHGKLHVARARGFLAGGGNLLGEIRRWVDPLAKGDVVVGQKHHLEPIFDGGVVVDHIPHGGDEFDHQLGHEVAWSRLAAKDEGARNHIQVGILLDALVEGDDVEDIEVLALVFVDALYLHVKHGIGVDGNARVLADVAGKILLDVVLNLSPIFSESGIVGVAFDLAQLIHVLQPAVANFFGVEGGEAGVGQGNPAAGGDAIGDVADFAGEHLMEVLEDGLFHQFRMQRRHAVDGIAAQAGQVRHPHIAMARFVNQRQASQFSRIVEVLNPHLIHKVMVDFVDDFQVAGQHPPKQGKRPFF